jgi:tetraacyldisaccharide-1-P 4'-kinase
VHQNFSTQIKRFEKNNKNAKIMMQDEFKPGTLYAVATIADPIRFKNAVKGHAVYNLLTNTKIVGRPELRI